MGDVRYDINRSPANELLSIITSNFTNIISSISFELSYLNTTLRTPFKLLNLNPHITMNSTIYSLFSLFLVLANANTAQAQPMDNTLHRLVRRGDDISGGVLAAAIIIPILSVIFGVLGLYFFCFHNRNTSKEGQEIIARVRAHEAETAERKARMKAREMNEGTESVELTAGERK